MIVTFTTCDFCNAAGQTHGRNGRGYVDGDRESAKQFDWIVVDGRDKCCECTDEERRDPVPPAV